MGHRYQDFFERNFYPNYYKVVLMFLRPQTLADFMAPLPKGVIFQWEEC